MYLSVRDGHLRTNGKCAYTGHAGTMWSASSGLKSNKTSCMTIQTDSQLQVCKHETTDDLAI